MGATVRPQELQVKDGFGNSQELSRVTQQRRLYSIHKKRLETAMCEVLLQGLLVPTYFHRLTMSQCKWPHVQAWIKQKTESHQTECCSHFWDEFRMQNCQNASQRSYGLASSVYNPGTCRPERSVPCSVSQRSNQYLRYVCIS